MSNSDFGDRTLPPTERRRREARQRGEGARSAQLTSALVLLAASCWFWAMIPVSLSPMAAYLRKELTSIQTMPFTIDSASDLMRSTGAVFAAALTSLGGLLLISAVVANLTQVGWIWIPSAIAPRFRPQNLNLGRRLIEISGFILRFIVLGCVIWRFMTRQQWSLYSLSLLEPGLMFLHLVRMLAEFCLCLSVSLILIGLADYGYRFWRYEQSLKMTFEELRQEQREDSIDPQIRNRQAEANHHRDVPKTLSEIGPVSAASR